MEVKPADARMVIATRWIWQHPNWPDFTWQQSRLESRLRDIHQLQGRLLGSMEGVASEESLQNEMDALLRNAINTSAIDGVANPKACAAKGGVASAAPVESVVRSIDTEGCIHTVKRAVSQACAWRAARPVRSRHRH
jgi:hypothetical protein